MKTELKINEELLNAIRQVVAYLEENQDESQLYEGLTEEERDKCIYPSIAKIQHWLYDNTGEKVPASWEREKFLHLR